MEEEEEEGGVEGPPLVAHLLPDRSEGSSMCPAAHCLTVAADPQPDTKRTQQGA